MKKEREIEKGMRKGRKKNFKCQKCIRHFAGNTHKHDLNFTIVTTLNAENHVKRTSFFWENGDFKIMY